MERLRNDTRADLDEKLELLDLGASIYSFWLLDERYVEELKQTAELARGRYGEFHPAIINWQIADAELRMERGDHEGARTDLEAAQKGLAATSLQASGLSAYWWRVQGSWLDAEPGCWERMVEARRKEFDLAKRYLPNRALARVAQLRIAEAGLLEGQFEEVRRQALEVIADLDRARSVDQADLYRSFAYRFLALALEAQGRSAEAERAWPLASPPEQASETAAGVPTILALHAWALIQRGELESGSALLDQATRLASASPADSEDALAVRQVQAFKLFEDGQALRAAELMDGIAPLLHPNRDLEIPEFWRHRAEAWAAAGQRDAALRALDEAFDHARAWWPATGPEPARLDELRGRLLLDGGRADQAAPAFRQALERARPEDTALRVSALLGLARTAGSDRTASASSIAEARKLLSQPQGPIPSNLVTYLDAVAADPAAPFPVRPSQPDHPGAPTGR